MPKEKHHKKDVKIKEEEEKIEIGDVEEPKEDIEVKEKDYRTITLTLDFYENIVPLHPISDIQTKCKYLDRVLGDTTLMPVTDDPNLVIDESFYFKVNVNSKRDTDHLISSPAILTITQLAGTCDLTLYEQLQKCEDLKNVSSVKSFESIVSIYEAFTGDTVDREIVNMMVKKTKGKGKKSEKKKEKEKEKKSKDKSSKGSKPSNPSKSTTKSGANSKKHKAKKSEITVVEFPPTDVTPLTYGMCTIDFLPLFHGQQSFTETLTIKPIEKFNDERMATYMMLPKITVTVSIDKEICFNNPVILNLTVESIYNIPAVMRPEMDYKICTMIPMESSAQEPTLFTNPSYTKKTKENDMKCWPGIKKMGENANTTKYKISDEIIKNKTGSDSMESDIKSSGPRLQFNTLKRNLLLKEGFEAFCHQVQAHRKILLEIYLTGKDKPSTVATSKPSAATIQKTRSDPSVKSSRDYKSETGSRKKSQIYLHLMAIVDISSLLYPGVTKVRVAAPITTFSFDEAVADAGATDSHFVPKPVKIKEDPQEEVADPMESLKETAKSDTRQTKSKKKDKDKSSKSSKSSKKSAAPKVTNQNTDLKIFLPPQPEAPPLPEPSIPVFSESGKQSFIVMEIELSQPIFEKRDTDNLDYEFQELMKEKVRHPRKIVLTHRLTKDYYREVLNEITKDIYDQYKHYKSTKENSAIAEKDFINYLEGIGAYQSYLTSIKEAISLLTTTKFRLDENDKRNSVLYQNFIGEVFVYLVSEMNDALNRLICNGLEPAVAPKPKPSDKLYFYAKEAAALRKIDLADRYFLEKICYYGNADSWFDYAVFNLELNQFDRAYECVLEAISKKPTHRYSLLLLGIMLTIKGQKDEAETCFLNLLVHESRWVEGWVALYLFYQKQNRYEGMDMAMDMVKKYLDDERAPNDYFNEIDDLLWTSKICPRSMFFRTAVLMLKIRLYDWVELALAEEVEQNFGMANYLLAAVCMYKGQHEQALEHIEQTKAYCGPNYAICALSGHCLYALNRQIEAKEDYDHVLDSLNRPDDIYLVYVNCAQILKNSGKNLEARKLILLACKHCPTHYTWFKAGQLYLQENDLLSAEECFSEANFKDNRCAKYWGYLTLINLQLNRANEAELCYSQAIKNNLDEELNQRIKKEFKKVSVEIV